MEDSTSEIPPKPVFVFREDYFTAEDFLQNFNHDMKKIRHLIFSNYDREFVKEMINQFMGACLQKVTDEDIVIHMHLECYETLAYYGDQYSSFETFENIIRDIEKPLRKDLIFRKRPGKANMVYGDVLLKYYGLKNDRNDGWYTQEAFDTISKAKYYLLKAYTQSIDGANKLTGEEQEYCVVLLAACFLLLSRWSEVNYFLEVLKRKHSDDANYNYITARNLQALKDRTCLNYNGQLLLKIIDCCDALLNSANIDPRRKADATDIRTKCEDNVEAAKLTIDRLRRHQQKVETTSKKRNAYFRNCIDNHLFLNEHAFFCPCNRSVGDKLEIKTQHPHTQMPWVDKFSRILNLLVADFSLARSNLFQAENQPIFFYKTESNISDALQLKKDALLKNAFKMCYSILDQIAQGIFEVLEIDIQAHLTEQAKARQLQQREALYFLNMWELYPFKEEDFRSNVYLVSLKSITKDLDRTDYSALKSFKKYRNAMEHTFLFIRNNKEKRDGPNFGESIERDALISKTRTLMVLTKSTIFSFAYLVRRQSKVKEVADNKEIETKID
jgi:hypothetical protein